MLALEAVHGGFVSCGGPGSNWSVSFTDTKGVPWRARYAEVDGPGRLACLLPAPERINQTRVAGRSYDMGADELRDTILGPDPWRALSMTPMESDRVARSVREGALVCVTVRHKATFVTAADTISPVRPVSFSRPDICRPEARLGGTRIARILSVTPPTEPARALTKALAEIAHRYGRNSAELAIAWVLRQPRVTSAIVGARKPGQIKETVFGGKFAIKPEDLARIDEALAIRG
jgi:hypothetical protein